jgi:hypothetical protein
VVKILYLCNKKYHDRKMSRVRFDTMGAIAATCATVYSGPGFSGWDDDLAAQENIDRIAPDCDLVVWYKPLEFKFPHRVTKPTCLRYNEMWDAKWTQEEILASNTDFVICHHKNDWQRYSELPTLASRRFVHIPHCADSRAFRNNGDSRTVDVLLSGAISTKTYPLRARFEKMIQRGMIPGVVRPHPGYRVENTKIVKAGYAASLRNAKIALVCGSVYRYRLAKIVEAAMCGCLVVGSLPEGEREEHGRFMVECNLRESDRVIADRINWWLRHNDLRQQRSAIGHGIMHDNYTCEHYADRFLSAATEFLATRVAA